LHFLCLVAEKVRDIKREGGKMGALCFWLVLIVRRKTQSRKLVHFFFLSCVCLNCCFLWIGKVQSLKLTFEVADSVIPMHSTDLTIP
jgi:hypothetical protein